MAGKTSIEGSTGALSVHGPPFPLAASPSPFSPRPAKQHKVGRLPFPRDSSLCSCLRNYRYDPRHGPPAPSPNKMHWVRTSGVGEKLLESRSLGKTVPPWTGFLGLPRDFTAFHSMFKAFQAWATGNEMRDQALLLTSLISHMILAMNSFPHPLPLSSLLLLSLPPELLCLLHPNGHTSARFSPPHNAPLQSVPAYLPPCPAPNVVIEKELVDDKTWKSGAINPSSTAALSPC